MREAWLAIYYLTWRGAGPTLEEGSAPWDDRPLEERETEELLTFVRLALQEVQRRGVPAPGPRPAVQVRITRSLRIYIGGQELRIRPLCKTVLLLFLRHPEGILLKRIGDHRREMESYYRRLNRSSNPATVEERISRIADIFNNDLNVSISRINAAITDLVNGPSRQQYNIVGAAGMPKAISLDRSLVIWE